jgi:hypothetical protein
MSFLSRTLFRSDLKKKNNGGKGFWKNKKKIREKYDIFRSDLPPRKIQFWYASVRAFSAKQYLPLQSTQAFSANNP